MNSNTPNVPALIPVQDVARMAEAVAKSGLFGMTKPEQAMSLMLIAQAEGTHPALAARDYHIIQGKPALKADAMLARFQQAGGKVEWTCMTDDKVAGKFSHPQGGSVEIDWDMERAKAAELGGKGMWKKYPRQMLRARVISEGIRTVYPGVVIGVYTPEEVQDFDDRPARNMGAAQTVEDQPKAEAKTAAPRQTGNVGEKEQRLRDMSKKIQDDLAAAGNLETLNSVWADYADGLDEIKEFKKAVHDHLEKHYQARLAFFAQAPVDESATTEAAKEGE
ncbi:MAG: hypothetical protein GC149_20495 [Gammaproteobacteria bacterium]|nr:hypothetical protein [Gammaproteobacteria bacterium]